MLHGGSTPTRFLSLIVLPTREFLTFFPKVSHEHRQVVVLSRRNLASFLSTLPDRLPLYFLQLPGRYIDI